jgi:hypothetical protein
MAVVTLNIHHRGLRGSRVPPLIRTIVLGYLAKYNLYCLLDYKNCNSAFVFYRIVFLTFEEDEANAEDSSSSSNNHQSPNEQQRLFQATVTQNQVLK